MFRLKTRRRTARHRRSNDSRREAKENCTGKARIVAGVPCAQKKAPGKAASQGGRGHFNFSGSDWTKQIVRSGRLGAARSRFRRRAAESTEDHRRRQVVFEGHRSHPCKRCFASWSAGTRSSSPVQTPPRGSTNLPSEKQHHQGDQRKPDFPGNHRRQHGTALHGSNMHSSVVISRRCYARRSLALTRSRKYGFFQLGSRPVFENDNRPRATARSNVTQSLENQRAARFRQAARADPLGTNIEHGHLPRGERHGRARRRRIGHQPRDDRC